jgi:hypothetical protein
MARLSTPVQCRASTAEDGIHDTDCARLGATEISIARCRELLGDEADSMTDQEIAAIRRNAETMACIVIEMYEQRCRMSE